MSAKAVATTEQITPIAVAAIGPSPTNPRKHFDGAKLKELALSMEKSGQNTPIVVRAARPGQDFEYELVTGERRWRAAKILGWESIDAIYRDLPDEMVVEIQLVENTQRDDLTALEEAETYHKLLNAGQTVDGLAGRVGKERKHVYERLQLLNLTPEAQALLRSEKITVNHAVVLARLKPADQDRAINPDFGGLFTLERMLSYDDRPASDDPLADFKPVSVRELESWVDRHVRFEVEAPQVAELFPETAATVTAAKEAAEKVVLITYEDKVEADAKGEDGERIIGPKSWKRADGKIASVVCDHSVVGVVAVGMHRGQSFRVCTNKKKCATHWGEEKKAEKKRKQAAAASATNGRDREALEEQQREEERRKADEFRNRYVKALPEILKAVAAAVKRSPAKAVSLLAEVLINEHAGFNMSSKRAAAFVPRGASAEDLVRHLAFLVLGEQASDDWNGPRAFPEIAKRVLGLDVIEILDKVAPAPVEEKVAEPAPAAKPSKAPAKKPAAKPTPKAKAPAKKAVGPIARKAGKK